MTNLIDLDAHRKPPHPILHPAVTCSAESGSVVLAIDDPRCDAITQLVWTPEAARLVARRIFAAAVEAERTKL